MTSGISAEYGRFTGGVINLITKSGGNTFSGSFRSNFSNSAWTWKHRARRQRAPSDRTSSIRITRRRSAVRSLRDRLWFFAAGRWQNTDNSQTLPETNAPFNTKTKDSRFEVERHRDDRHWPHAAGELHPRPDRSDAPAVSLVDRSARGREPDVSEQALRRDLQRRVSDRSCSPTSRCRRKKEGFRGSGGYDTDIHESPFFTVRRRRRGPRRTALQRQLFRRDRPRRS